MKLQLPSELTTRQGKRGKTKTCTIGEVVPYLPHKTCFFDIRHLVVDTDLLPFAVTTRINANNQQYLKELDMNEDITTKVACTLDEGKWARMHEQSRRVFDTDAIAPTQHCCGGGNLETKIAEPFVVASRGREPQCLTPKRTEYGKAIRKKYEAHEVTEQRKNIQKLEPRTDGVTNTLTSVQKDNMLCEPSFRIRKLTERECFRLMGCDEQTIDKIQASGVSRSQQYKLAGNSIVVDVLTAIFDKMFVHTEITELKLFY